MVFITEKQLNSPGCLFTACHHSVISYKTAAHYKIKFYTTSIIKIESADLFSPPAFLDHLTGCYFRYVEAGLENRGDVDEWISRLRINVNAIQCFSVV